MISLQNYYRSVLKMTSIGRNLFIFSVYEILIYRIYSYAEARFYFNEQYQF